MGQILSSFQTRQHRYQHVLGKVTALYIHTYASICFAHTVYSFHNKLKTVYLHGKMNRRIDFLLHVLLQVEKDNFFNYVRKSKVATVNRQMNEEATRHQNGMLIPESSIKVT